MNLTKKHSYDAHAGFGLDYYDIKEVNEMCLEKEKVKNAINRQLFKVNAAGKDLELHEFNDIIMDIERELRIDTE